MSNLVPSMDCMFTTIDTIYESYMPFLQNGGLFVKTEHDYDLGDLVLLKVTLLDDPTVYSISGKIAWITPKGAQSNKPAGIGVQFSDDTSPGFCHKVEMMLGARLNSSQTTNTM